MLIFYFFLFFLNKAIFSPGDEWILGHLVGFALLYSMSEPESPAPIYLFTFAALARLLARYFIRVYFLRASGF